MYKIFWLLEFLCTCIHELILLGENIEYLFKINADNNTKHVSLKIMLPELLNEEITVGFASLCYIITACRMY